MMLESSFAYNYDHSDVTTYGKLKERKLLAFSTNKPRTVLFDHLI